MSKQNNTSSSAKEEFTRKGIEKIKIKNDTWLNQKIQQNEK